jgi:gliding motility-associated-like protein
MSKGLQWLIFTLVFILQSIGYSQIPNYEGNCPSKPCVSYFNENQIIPIGNNEIHLGEGIISLDNNGSGTYKKYVTREFKWPCNRPTWPIAIAHAWTLYRTATGITQYDINGFSGVLFNETQMDCESGVDHSCYTRSVNDPTLVNDFGGDIPLISEHSDYQGNSHSHGCWQIDDLGQQALVEGLGGPCANCGFYKSKAEAEHLIQAFETGAISRAFYDAISFRRIMDIQGYDPLPVLNNANYKYGLVALLGQAYNKGQNDGNFLVTCAKNFKNDIPGALTSNDWWLTGHAVDNYGEACVHYNKILANDYTPKNAEDLQQWTNWYDNDIDWAMIDAYMDKVFPMFSMDPTHEVFVRTEVQKVFDQQKDGSGNVSFRYKLGPIIDKMVQLLPYNDPSYTNTNSQSAVSSCKGCVGPAVSLTNDRDGKIFEGQSVKLEAIFGDAYTYVWLKDENVIVNDNDEPHVFFAKESGAYAVVVTDEKGCSIRSDRDFIVTVQGGSTCNISINLNSVSNSCTDIGDGTITALLSGPDYSTSKSYSFTWERPDGSISITTTPSLTNITQGNYLITIEDVGDPSCIIHSNIVIIENEVIYQKLVISDQINADCQKTDLTANIEGNPPNNCEYAVEVAGWPDGGQTKCWQNNTGWPSADAYFTIRVNGESLGRRNPPSSGINGSGSCETLQESFGVTDGDLIELIVTKISCNSGTATNIFKEFSITDPRDVEISSRTNTIMTPGETIVLSATASCEQPDKDYTITWLGNTENESAGSNTSSVTGTGASWVKAEATAAGSSCVLIDSVFVKNECIGACDDPGTVTLSETGELNLCTPIAKQISTNITSGVGAFEYQLYKNGLPEGVLNTTGDFTLTVIGTYYVIVTDINSIFCSEQSNIIKIISSGNIAKPTFNTVKTSLCEGETSVLYEISPLSGATSYTWNYTSNGATINGTSESITIDFSIGVLSGNLDVFATGACGNSLTTTLGITINQNPQISVVDPSAQCGGNINLTAPEVIQSLTPSDAVLSVYSDIVVTSLATNPITISGDYYVQAIKGACKSSVKVVKVEINTTPAVPSGNDITLCQGNQLDLIVTSPDLSVTYNWSAKSATNSFVGVGENVLVNNVSIKSSDEGTYEVTATENGCISDPTTVTVSIDALPAAADVSSESLEVCVADVITLNALAVTNGGVGIWEYTSTGTGTVDDVDNPTSTISGLVDGEILTVKWKVNSANSYCNASEKSVVVTGKGIAEPLVTLTPNNTEVCEGAALVFTASATTAGAGPLYTFYDITSGSRVEVQPQSVSTTYSTTAGADDLTIEVELLSNSVCIGTNSAIAVHSSVVTVDALPNTAIVSGESTTCLGQESLSATVVENGVPSWAITNGPGSLANPSSIGVDVTGLVAEQSTEVTLTINSENGYCLAKTAVFTIDRLGEITEVDVLGQSGSICFDETKPTLVGNTPKSGETATWVSLTTGATIASSTGVVSQWILGDNEFEYTITNAGGCTDSEIVTIKVDAVPTDATVASATIVTCTDPVNLNADEVLVGTGVWTILSGTGNIVSGQENVPLAEAENLAENDDLVLEWTVSNGACVNRPSEQVTVDKAGELTSAEITIDGNTILEGVEVEVCNLTTSSVVGSVPVGTESGAWAIGNPSIVDAGFTALKTGTTSLSWTITSSLAGCLPSTRTISIKVIDKPVVPVFTAEGNTAALCEGEQGSFSIDAMTDVDSYNWYIGGVLQTSKEDLFATILATVGSAINVEVAAVNKCGEGPKESTLVEVKEIPSMTIQNLNDQCGGTYDLANSIFNLSDDATLSYYSDIEGLVSIDQVVGELSESITNYFVQAEKAGCKSLVVPVAVEIKNVPSEPAGKANLVCAGDQLIFSVVGAPEGITYTWVDQNGGIVGKGNFLVVEENASTLNEQQYSVMATKDGCDSPLGYFDVALKLTPTPSLSIADENVTGKTVNRCIGDAPIVLSVINNEEGEVISWSRNTVPTFGANSTIAVSQGGEYEVTLDNLACKASVSVLIETQILEVNIVANTDVLDLGQSVDLTAVVSGDDGHTMLYIWSDLIEGETYANSSEITIEPTETDSYQVVVIDQTTLCTDTSSLQEVRVYLPVVIPNAFTPNGDGINDTWYIEGIYSYPNSSVLIYNRWGQKVYEKQNGYEPWKGVNMNNKSLTIGTYYYIIYLGDERGLKYQGDVSIIK